MPTYELTGDEALGQGAWEAGVYLAAGYPGSPSTRFLEHLVEISQGKDVYVEWSANEKVAFEVALGASMGGRRAVVSFKSVGLNLAMDPFMVANLGGVGGGMVVILGDDPGAWGSQTGHLPKSGELFQSHLIEAIRKSLAMKIAPSASKVQEGFPAGVVSLPLPRQCPFYQAFAVFSTVLPADPRERPIFVGDDGCLIRLMNEPFSLLDCKFCMGSSIGIASGLARTGERRKIVALIGDSSFYHTGLPSYLNAVANNVGIMIVILDNRSTAMTGCQSNPGTAFNIRGNHQEGVGIESILKSVPTKTFRAVEASGNKTLLVCAFRECLESKGVSVLLVSGLCPNLTAKVC